MDIWLKFVLLLIAGYLLGSIPLSYLSGRSRGVNLKKQGTHQVGAGNLWRTTSRTLGFFVGAYDFLKGMLMAYIANLAGLEPALQLFVGIAVILGHNWPVFLKFHGGRGIATALGLIIIMPGINYSVITIWPMIVFFGLGIAVLFIAHRTPVPVLFALIAMAVASAIAREPVLLTIAYASLVVVVIIKRLTAQPNKDIAKGTMGRVYLNRFLFDRDIRDRVAWVQRKDLTDEEYQ
jgi:acyl phosphate:glycerol-3-phosphate acyltransferase